MNPTLPTHIKRWSLERLQFLLGHLEDFIEDDSKDIRTRAAQFVSADGLDKIQDLLVTEPNDPALPTLLLEKLSAFYESGLLLQRGPAAENANWWATDVFWRGNVFHLDLEDQIQVNKLVPEVAPLQVQRALAQKTLASVKLDFLVTHGDAHAYLIKPTPTLAYVLISNLPAPWSADHVAHTHRLINKCFIY